MQKAITYQVTNYKKEDWDQLISKLPNPHVLQTWEWGALKSRYGWEPIQIVWFENDRVVSASLLLKRSLRIPLFSNNTSVIYVPKGPSLDWGDYHLRQEVLQGLLDYAKTSNSLFIKMDPDVVIGKGLTGTPNNHIVSAGENLAKDLKQLGWRYSDEQIQFKNTVQIDLSPSEDMLLANMKQKTRYNIRLAGRKGVSVRTGTLDDLDLLYQMYAETSLRDGFTIRQEEYYKSVWKILGRFDQRIDQENGSVEHHLPLAEPLIAEVNGEPVAAVIIFRFARKAWYMYGMSRAIHRDKMPNYLLQWEAMRRAKAAGCHTYDLWGAPDAYDESDPLWRVYQFKEGFGGTVIRHLGAWDLPTKPYLYKIYNSILPRILSIMRISGRRSTRQSFLS